MTSCQSHRQLKMFRKTGLSWKIGSTHWFVEIGTVHDVGCLNYPKFYGTESTHLCRVIVIILLPMPTTVTWFGFLVAFVCVGRSVFPHNILESDAARSSNLTYKCYIVSPGNPFIYGSRSRSSSWGTTKNIACVDRGALVSAGLLLLLLLLLVSWNKLSQ